VAEIVNLRRVRKAKARADAQTLAAANRAAFGRTLQQRQADQRDADRVSHILDCAKRET
jgi:hypothetical protein